MSDRPEESTELDREVRDVIELLTTTRETVAEELGCSTATLYSWSVGRRSPRRGNQSKLADAARVRARHLVACADRLDGMADTGVVLQDPLTVGERLRREHRAIRGRLRTLREDARAARARLIGFRRSAP